MIESLRLRWAIIATVFLLAVIWTVPNFVSFEKSWWPTKNRMVLGLDIQGGSHLVLRVDVDSAVKQDTKRLADSLPRELEEDKQHIKVKGTTITEASVGGIDVLLEKPEDGAKVTEFLNRMYGNSFRVLATTPDAVKIEFGELYLRDFKSKLLDQAIAVIRNRIDEFGVAEPSITAQGTDRVLVQLPGIKDASSAKDLINRTARLDFMMLDDQMPPEKLTEAIAEVEKTAGLKFAEMKYSQYVDRLNEGLKGKIPENTIVYFEKPENAVDMNAGRRPYLLKTNEAVAGDKLTNAFVTFDNSKLGGGNEPVVSFSFDPIGTRLFGELTTKNVHKPMAIVLDKVVKSAPVIQTPITGGHGQITLGRSRNQSDQMKEAKLIATALRAGALPATLEQLEERTVGPSLGADAIRQGQIGTLLAALAVFVVMFFYYKSFGLIADISLAFNLLITVAILSALGATLTLPGVAGLALTLGIAVDASVIIFERVKEEMSKGATVATALREGYDRAFSSIFDANVTSIAVCVVLYYYGTGPVRGFAVTLLTGLVITTFTAVFFTRAVFDLMIVKLKWNLSVK